MILKMYTGMLEKGKVQVHAQNISEEVIVRVGDEAGWSITFDREPAKVQSGALCCLSLSACARCMFVFLGWLPSVYPGRDKSDGSP